MRRLVALLVAAAIVLGGFALIASQSDAPEKVYAKRGVGISLEQGPSLHWEPQLLTGKTRKAARWEDVNAVQYAGCSTGDRWTGTLCQKFTIGNLPSFHLNAPTTVAGLLAAAMVVVPIVSAANSTTKTAKKVGKKAKKHV